MSELVDPLRMGKRRRLPLLVGVGIAVVFLVLAAAFVRLRAGPKPQAVRVAMVERGLIKSRVLAQGTVRARRQVQVGSEISGRVTEVFVQVGQAVKAGDPLFALDDEQHRVNVRSLQVQLRAANAMAQRARLLLGEAGRQGERDERLNERGVLAGDTLRASQARVQLAQADLEQSTAQVERARLELARAEDSLTKARVLAPIAGTVVDVRLEVGQVVAPVSGLSAGGAASGLSLPGMPSGESEASVVLADLTELIARLDVDELDVSQVAAGQAVEIEAQGQKSERFSAVVTRVGLMGREASGSVLFPVEARLALSADGTDGEAARALGSLRPGMSVAAEIEVGRLEGALKVPLAAVLEGDGKKLPDRVFRFEGGLTGAEAREVSVTLGPTDDESVAVLTGLSEGQELVEGPFRALRDLKDGDLLTREEEPERGKPGASR
jgi:HlyD family secretion protein